MKTYRNTYLQIYKVISYNYYNQVILKKQFYVTYCIYFTLCPLLIIITHHTPPPALPQS